VRNETSGRGTVHVAIGKNIVRSLQIAHTEMGSAVVYRSGQKRY
jgi:hypothetical protein